MNRSRTPVPVCEFLLASATCALLWSTAGHAAATAAATAATAAATATATATATADETFHDVDQFWSQQIASLGGRYRSAKVTHYTPSSAKLCGLKVPVSGSFYCPSEETVYLDDTFLERLQRHARAGTSLTIGYLVAHELAHHIQAVLGTTALVEQARARSTPEIARRSWITMELQADCYVGLWAHAARSKGALAGTLDVDAMLADIAGAAREQQSHLTVGQQMIDPLDQGTPEQRSRWFRRGLDTGSFNDCDTFTAEAAGKL